MSVVRCPAPIEPGRLALAEKGWLVVTPCASRYPVENLRRAAYYAKVNGTHGILRSY